MIEFASLIGSYVSGRGKKYNIWTISESIVTSDLVFYGSSKTGFRLAESGRVVGKVLPETQRDRMDCCRTFRLGVNDGRRRSCLEHDRRHGAWFDMIETFLQVHRGTYSLKFH